MGCELHRGLCCLAAALMLGGCVAHPVYRAQDLAPPLRPEPTPVPGSPQGDRPSDAPRPRPTEHRRPDAPSPSGTGSALASVVSLDTRRIDTSTAYQMGLASFTGRELQGRRTASGERYSLEGLTAAHRLLPLGTRVRVTNLENGRRVDLRVNDRGPFHPGRVIDVSYAAAVELGMVDGGTTRVMVEVIGTVD
ncbi:MAG: septal ring lytic transglycosylase RlpA family protein [Candidatus Latescibacterota bacterium]